MSNWLSTSPRAGVALAAVIFAAIYIAAAGIIIIYTLIHGCLHSSSSPFQSTASRFVEIIGRHISRLFESIRTHVIPTTVSHATFAKYNGNFHTMNEEETQTFHDSVQTTHDDASLDLATAALFSVILLKFDNEIVFSDNAIQTLHYLLSSEASIRANVTAAASIVNGYGTLVYPSSITEMQRTLIFCAHSRTAFSSTLYPE